MGVSVVRSTGYAKQYYKYWICKTMSLSVTAVNTVATTIVKYQKLLLYSSNFFTRSTDQETDRQTNLPTTRLLELL